MTKEHAILVPDYEQLSHAQNLYSFLCV